MTDTTSRVLAQLLDDPARVQTLRALPPPRFGALVRELGLEDAGELMALATSSQTLAVLDEQLWTDGAGSPEEQLEPERFALWLDVLLQGGDGLTARRLLELPEALLIAGLCGQLFVLDVDALGHSMAGASWRDAELAERILDACLYLELDGYTLVAKRGLGWDPTVAALLALDRVDHERTARVLGCCHAITLQALEGEEDGLQTILSAQETVEADALADRNDRRAAQGFVASADAKAFLKLAEQTPLDPEAWAASLQEDPITRACVREQLAAAEPSPATAPTPAPAWLDALEPIGEPAPNRALPEGASCPVETAAVTRLRAALQALQRHDPDRHTHQLVRLAFLANVLMTAGRRDGDAHEPLSASREALQITAEGLDRYRAERARQGDPWAPLERVGVDGLFRLGWRSRP
ncbi:hypothetical protein PPSIR1_31283 [Plesiocystis pacifica SIR-1]|uniref:Uncharacterized protein n=1 Tax=Plesiocystis pacifica SIR-1 TaxID=391625 RepID=A6GDB9_9BACT|nr:hypothetical protein PPSIR1_31283 [Plesiocystis pacifica SIR-1]